MPAINDTPGRRQRLLQRSAAWCTGVLMLTGAVCQHTRYLPLQIMVGGSNKLTIGLSKADDHRKGKDPCVLQQGYEER